jgi:hypothetical protein
MSGKFLAKPWQNQHAHGGRERMSGILEHEVSLAVSSR